MADERKTITVNGKEYFVDELNKKQLKCLEDYIYASSKQKEAEKELNFCNKAVQKTIDDLVQAVEVKDVEV